MVKIAGSEARLEMQDANGNWQAIDTVDPIWNDGPTFLTGADKQKLEATARDVQNSGMEFLDAIISIKNALCTVTFNFDVSKMFRAMKKARNRARYQRRYKNIGRKAGHK